jgi:hypothetical protein
LILRKRPVLERPANVTAADVHLPQSLELNDGELAHDRVGRGALYAEFGHETLSVQEFGKGDRHAEPPEIRFVTKESGCDERK